MTKEERDKLIEQMVDIMENHESFDGQSINHNRYGSAEEIMKLFEQRQKEIEEKTEPLKAAWRGKSYIEKANEQHEEDLKSGLDLKIPIDIKFNKFTIKEDEKSSLGNKLFGLI